MQKLVHRSVAVALVLGLIIFTFTSCTNTTGGTNPGADVAATVNGTSIMMSEVETVLNQRLKGQQAQMSPLELAQARMQIVDSLIQQEVLYQKAQKENTLPTEEEITQAINQEKQQSGLTEDAYQKALKDAGQTDQNVRESARKQIAIRKLLEKVVSKVGSPSDKEVEEFFNGNRKEYVNQRGVELAMIAVDPEDNGAQDDAKSESEAKSKIDLIYQQLKQADFAEVARARSEDPSNVRSGDIGFANETDLKRSNFPQSLIDEMFGKMEVGSFTAPVRFASPQYPAGRWYIFKLKRKQLQEENLDLNSPGVRQEITTGLSNQRKQLLSETYVKVAMSEAKVVNNLAARILDSPNNLSGARPAQQPGTTPASTTPAATPAATAPPQGAATPASTASPR